MTQYHIYKCTIKYFNIKEAFDAIDILFAQGYMSVSCADKHDKWIVEVLHDKPIQQQDISRVLNGLSFTNIEIERLENIDWLKKCFENFRPISVGSFYIYGPHLRGSEIPTNKIPIEVAAATAFGTGEHPTTRNCLAACETFFDNRRHKSALDIGCGSCILSIALAKLGARKVVACDNDAEAVRVSKENVITNKVAHRVYIFQNQACEFANSTYDFIVANILSDPLRSMSSAIVNSLSNEGTLVLSGFTSDDNSVLDRYTSLGLKVKFRYDLKEWTTLVLQR